MNRKPTFFLLLGAGYSFIFILSLLFIVPHYLSSGLGAYLLALLTDTEIETRPVRSFFAPLIWMLMPLSSVGLCVMSWVAFDMSVRSQSETLKKFTQLGGALFFAASILPAIIVVRELLAYHVLGVELPDVLTVLTQLTRAMEGIMDPTVLIARRGAWVVPLVVFVETGLFFGFFLPGDSLLLTVGVLGAAKYLDLMVLIPSSILAAALGDQLGYAIGRRTGDALSLRYRFVNNNLQRAADFYSKHGGKAIVLARFVPVVRTFAPIVAGAAKMNYLRFTLSNFVGGAFWVLSVTLVGYLVGSLVPSLIDYLGPLLIIIVVSSPLAWLAAWMWERVKKR